MSETTALCERCTLGNHTGSNGTPGCTGGGCACSCRTREGDPEPFAPRHVYGLEIEKAVARFGPRSTLVVDGTSNAGNVIVRVGHELTLEHDGATGWEQTEHVVLSPAEARSLAVVLAELVESDTLADVEAGA